MPMVLTGVDVVTESGEIAQTFAFAPAGETGRSVATSVAIVGVGLPFGRFQDTSVRAEAVTAVRQALADDR